MTFGEELKKLIKVKCMKHSELAKVMNVTVAYISQLVTGHRRPGRETLLKLSNVLDVPVDTLMMLDSEDYERIRGARQVPVLDGANIRQWLNEREVSPLLFTDAFEYAETCDPQAFYARIKDCLSCCGLEKYDLLLVEPNSKIESRNTVLVCSVASLSVRKCAVKDHAIILFDVDHEPIIYTETDNIDGITLLRLKQCIKNL
jgi:transcriptional regulator with XRE-family HTH domain